LKIYNANYAGGYQMYGDDQRSLLTMKTITVMKRRVPGLRDEAPPSECKVYKMVEGKKTLIRIEK